MTTELSNAHNLYEELVQAVSFSKQSFVIMGRLLHDLYKDETYKSAVGDGVDTWVSFLAQPEIGLSKGEASRLMQIYEQFVLRLGFSENYVSEIPIKNVHYILPVVKKLNAGSAEVDIVVEDAKNLSQRDLRERMYDAKNEDSERTYTYFIMRKCVETGSMNKVHGIESEDIKKRFNLQEYV